jgi:2-polyprenyl-6-methoxyphenol hydroxylase-like FAD-dependent oxidoreductase
VADQRRLTLVIAAWPYREFEANRTDIEGTYRKTLALAPAFAGRVDASLRESRFFGGAVHNYFRKPYGPGWVLVGDAGYDRDFITAQGIQDAFRDAELCAAALNDSCPVYGRSRPRWTTTSRPATGRHSRCTNSPASSPPSNLRHLSLPTSSARCVAIRTR